MGENSYFFTWKILNVLYLRAPKELEAHIHRFQSTHEYYELTKFQRQTPSQSEDRANFVIFWNPILKIALSTVGEPTLNACSAITKAGLHSSAGFRAVEPRARKKGVEISDTSSGTWYTWSLFWAKSPKFLWLLRLILGPKYNSRCFS